MKIWHDKNFWLEYLKNPLCFLGSILVFVMCFLIVVIPFIYSQNPTDQRVWIGATPPGFSHPTSQQESTFEVGKKIDSSHFSNSEKIEYTIQEELTTEIRIVTNSSGKIQRMKEGFKSLKELNKSDFLSIHKILPNQKRVKIDSDFKLKSKENIPELFGKIENNVLILEALVSKENRNVEILLQDNIISEIKLNNKPLPKISIKGENVLKIISNNQELTTYHLLGTDELGRDLLARVLYGGRISLMVGIVATIVSILIGVVYGAVSAYYGGTLDRIMMSAVDILYAIPFMFLVIILMVSFGNNLILLFVALGAVQWLTMARIVRGQVLSLKEMEYIEAARMCGSSNLKIILKHLIPHTIGPVIVYTSLTVPVVILEESFLSFIGLQVQFQGESLDSWGTLIDQGIKALGEGGERYWLLLWPSLAMATTLFGLNALGDGLRDLLDPKMKKRNQ